MTAVYVTTGAPVPEGFSCVVPIEETKLSEDQIKVEVLNTAKLTEGKWIREPGCDIKTG
jgi:molybdopterin molybdotransferase